MSELSKMKCIGCEGGIQPLTEAEAKGMMSQLNDWVLSDDAKVLSKKFEFKGYGKTMAFTNAVAWIAHQEKHHPDLEVTYNSCTVNYTTHAIDGLSQNDFICAAKVDALFS